MRLIILAAFITASACSSGDPGGDRAGRYDRRLFPVDPHFVVSILDVHEAPNVVDTQYVFVGTLVDTQDPRFDLRAEAADTLGWIYRRVRLPWMFSTVVQTAQVLRARLRYDNAATVTLTGPFGGAQRAIALRPLGHGFYYFRGAEHPLVGEADYTLDVLTGSGVRLRSTMRTPGPFVWPLPARHDIRVRKYVHEGRVYGEMDDEEKYVVDPTSVSVRDGIEVRGVSNDLALDRCTEHVPEGKSLRHEFLGDLIRSNVYGVGSTAYTDAIRSRLIWGVEARCGRRDSVVVYQRRAHMDLKTYAFYHEESGDVGVGTPLEREKGLARGNATVTRDGSHYVRVSNVHRVGGDGSLSPVASSEAVGIFGAMTSQYRQTVLHPVRTYDACTVYPGTRCRDGSTSPPQAVSAPFSSQR